MHIILNMNRMRCIRRTYRSSTPSLRKLTDVRSRSQSFMRRWWRSLRTTKSRSKEDSSDMTSMPSIDRWLNTRTWSSSWMKQLFEDRRRGQLTMRALSHQAHSATHLDQLNTRRRSAQSSRQLRPLSYIKPTTRSQGLGTRISPIYLKQISSSLTVQRRQGKTQSWTTCSLPPQMQLQLIKLRAALECLTETSKVSRIWMRSALTRRLKPPA